MTAEPCHETPPSLVWHEGVLVAGHGVASGRNPDSPYPSGSLAMQAPLFQERGLDLAPFQLATLNLDFSPGVWRLRDPQHHMPQLRWCELHPPETFSFWPVQLRRRADGSAPPCLGLIYHPHPETKQAHHHSPGLLEVLAPPLAAVEVGERWVLGVDPHRCRLIQPARLRARLLEFLKFRVLAAQEAFFGLDGGAGSAADGSPVAGEGSEPAQVMALRRWLAGVWPEACDLSDADLWRTLEQARHLYTEEPRRHGP